MDTTNNQTFFETYRRGIESYIEYHKYKMSVRGVKAGLVFKGMKILTELYGEKDQRVRMLKKKELDLVIMGLDGLNYIHNDV